MRRDLKVKVGEVITHVDGVPSLSANAMGQLLRDRAGRQVRLRLRGEAGAERDVIVEPISAMEEMLLRYGDWERSRRLRVEELGGGKIGYVHLRAMGEEDWAQFAENFYPVFDRAGLIIDVRHNRGGNIDSWVLEKLMRQAWMYWQPRVGKPTWNMQYAFRGHMIMLCDENSASDGEAVCEGFRRLGLGKVLGVRTWGGEIWLSMSNDLVDLGIASAAELGVYGPEREWLIEGWGFEPDIVVENPPHATFVGGDAQLDAAVKHLLERIAEDPREVPPPPAGPDKRKDSAEGRRGGRP